MSDLRELSTEGRVVQPGDEDWDDTRAAWNLIADQRPTAVALVHGAADVAAVVRFAAGRRVSRRSGRLAPAIRQRAIALATFAALLTAGCLLAANADAAQTRAASPRASDAALQRAIEKLASKPEGPPGIAVVVQRGRRKMFDTAGVADVRRKRAIKVSDHMRLASVAKAFSGAVALSLVAEGKLSLADTVGKWLPGLPAAWSAVTLRELLGHTSGIPDFSQTEGFGEALGKSLLVAPAPEALLAFAPARLEFTPGSRYHYSNSDNVIVALIAAAAGHGSYQSELQQRVVEPLGLSGTSLPISATMPRPFVHAYVVDPPKAPEDVSELFAAGWSWASGGVVSTPRDANTFVRAYVRGTLTNIPTHAAQLTFVAGSSEPAGPGANSAGLAIFRYRTRCGTVYGHTGNTAGYTQFIAANASGTRSTVVSVNAQITPKADAKRFAELRRIYALAVCSALA
ncbi:MAG TPA: serine hydrolase domain-containing protein [Solirubrobacteraceae bacterium]|nr:serine hydrolase domain-containing protein [Solirubrobacteraceae bacterium]